MSENLSLLFLFLFYNNEDERWVYEVLFYKKE